MATTIQHLLNLATRVATELKAIRTLVNGNAPGLGGLATTAKTNLVAAINELKQAVDSAQASGGATINDASRVSATQTWSIVKIVDELAATEQAVKDAILGGAGAAVDTLAELAALLEGKGAEIATILTAVGNRVRVDVANQGLTAEQKANARTNIGCDVTSAQIGNPDTDLVAIFEAGLA